MSLVSLGAALMGGFVYVTHYQWVDLSVLKNEIRSRPSIILDDEGNELARFELDKREFVDFNDIPDVVIKAFVAAEDHAFFNHIGISLKGVIRSALVNLYYRRVVQGASTITQQVARLMFLSHERTFWRKFKEIFVALQLERQLTKEHIMELYLNNVYFGRGIYGVQAACKRFWNKPVDEIVLHEAAVLAAVAKSARFYSPLNAPLTAQKRRNTVLLSMLKQEMISVHDYHQAKEEVLKIEDHIPGNQMRLYVQEWIRAWAERTWSKDILYTQGLKIQTTINTRMQDSAECSFKAGVVELRKQMGESLNGGLMCIQTSTGKIKAVVGGLSFKESQFNRAFQAYRQTGSTFKPILYSYLLEKGLDFDQVFVDEPFELVLGNSKTWKPRNWTYAFHGPMTLVKALTTSSNIVAIKALLAVGLRELVPWLEQFGLHHSRALYPSIALGTVEATVEQNVAAFNVFANNGTYVQPYVVSWVKDRWGKKIWEHEEHTYQALSSRITSKMVKALIKQMVLWKVRKKADWIEGDSIGKTGSTNGSATTWFVGATPEYTTAVYVGRDDNKQMGRYVYASSTAFPIWLGFMKQVPSIKPHFYFDPTLKEVLIDWSTGESINDPERPEAVAILK